MAEIITFHYLCVGSFSEIYVGRDISENSAASKDNNSTNGISSDGNSNSNSGNTDFVAIKLQHQDVDPTVIRWESEVLQILAGESVVPKFVTNGKDENREYLVMEYLNGEDMAAIRNKIRTNNPTGLIPLTISVYLTKQMLSCVECLHKHGVLHRDIKPSNFVRKSRNSSQFSVIDFGIAKLVRTITNYSFRTYCQSM